MTPFKAYKLYIIYKAFFLGEYDLLKYGDTGRKISEESYNRRKDKVLFEIASRKYGDYFTEFLVANLSKDPHMHISEMLEDYASERYMQWKRIRESLTYTISSEISLLKNDDFKVDQHQHPGILQKYLGKKISMETLLVLFDVTNIDKYINTCLKEDLIWKGVFNRINRYREIYSYDNNKLFPVVQQKLLDKGINISYIT
jgi:T4 gene Gp59 loader of gp41 DNA helicase